MIEHVDQLIQADSQERLIKRLAPHDDPLPPTVPGGSLTTSEAVAAA